MSDGVLVLGMHRSGTSVATRLAAMLGPSVCVANDLTRDRRGNERGVWESASLVRCNDALLTEAGAAWWRPPPLGHDWTAAVRTGGARAAAVFRRAHPGPHWIWKDPRTCLTAPFWLDALAVQPAVLLLLRDPCEISASLTARNQFSAAAGLALWEHYLRAAARAVVGLPVHVSRYDDLLADPRGWLASVAQLFVDAGLPADLAAAHNASGYLDPALRHRARRSAAGALTSGQTHLAAALDELVGVHHRFPALRLGPMSSAMPATLFAPARRQPRQPPASVVVISRNEGVTLRESVDALRATSADGTEVIVVDDASDDGSAEGLDGARVIRAPERLGIARARNLGARAARGRMLVFSDAHVRPDEGWFKALSAALDDRDVGLAGPRLAGFASGARAVSGLAFADETLNVRWFTRDDAEPFDVPLLAGCFLAMRREVFTAYGGFDDGMSGYGAEDLELCLRLWRTGYRCVSVPGAFVRHRFRRPAGQVIDRTGFLHNVLRLATLHLAPPRLARVVAALRSEPEFAAAAARLLAGDVGTRRAELRALCWFDDTTFLRRFGPAQLLEEDP